VQDLVEQCRSTAPDVDQVRSQTYAVTERGYALLLGLRRQRDWSALRPRAVALAVSALRAAFDVVVCDSDADVEGQVDSGSLDVEERNSLARASARAADVVFAVGQPSLKGVYSLGRVIDSLCGTGVSPERIVPVFNRAARGPRHRGQVAAALASVVSDAARTAIPTAIFVAERDVDDVLHDRRRLPPALGAPLESAFDALMQRLAALPPTPAISDARRVAPDEVGRLAQEAMR
jgi:hypothetical protein